jgi:hypothetical protein
VSHKALFRISVTSLTSVRYRRIEKDHREFIGASVKCTFSSIVAALPLYEAFRSVWSENTRENDRCLDVLVKNTSDSFDEAKDETVTEVIPEGTFQMLDKEAIGRVWTISNGWLLVGVTDPRWTLTPEWELKLLEPESTWQVWSQSSRLESAFDVVAMSHRIVPPGTRHFRYALTPALTHYSDWMSPGLLLKSVRHMRNGCSTSPDDTRIFVRILKEMVGTAMQMYLRKEGSKYEPADDVTIKD